MTSASERWKRVLKVRAVQRRVLEIQLFKSEAEARALADLRDRINAIRDAAQPLVGINDGVKLQYVCELSSRLNAASRALAYPSKRAAEASIRDKYAVLAAKQRETVIEKLDTAAAQQEAKNAQDRQLRANVFRKSLKQGGTV